MDVKKTGKRIEITFDREEVKVALARAISSAFTQVVRAENIDDVRAETNEVGLTALIVEIPLSPDESV